MALKVLWLYAFVDMADISDLFLGESISAPNLRRLSLTCIPFPFPVLRKLLLSAPNLVVLSLRNIPRSAYFSPEAMVTCLSALTRLKHARIQFKSPRSHHPQEGRHPSPTRFVLPALTELAFIGVSEYLEDLVIRIDACLIKHLRITFVYQRIFDTPQLVQFISRTPKLNAYDEARVIFSSSSATIAHPGRDNVGLELEISSGKIQTDWQLSSRAQVCASSFRQALIPTMEHYILEDISPDQLWQDNFVNNKWLELLH